MDKDKPMSKQEFIEKWAGEAGPQYGMMLEVLPLTGIRIRPEKQTPSKKISQS